MRKWLFVFAAGIIILLVAGGVIGAVGERAQINAEVFERLKDNEKVKVIISVDESKSGAGILSSNPDRDEIIDLIGEDKVGYKFQYTESFSAEISEKELDKLKGFGNIIIKEDRIAKLMMQNTTIITNATELWPADSLGMNLTGEGQTVCIIDTGVYYSHPDLGGCFGAGCKVLAGIDIINGDSNPIDDHGHGTHIAGTISSNGSLKGIAPGVKIAAVKVLDALGAGGDSNIIAGIDWCVGNASLYNITVISMSLGYDCDDFPQYCYPDYCQNESTEAEYAASINAAFARNISVVIATGNDGNTNLISTPSCIQNATAVGSTTKADSISSFSNRNSLVALFATGGTSGGTGTCTAGTTDENRICSASKTGAYISMSGTSMATPHIAAAFALINQYLNITGKTKTPKEIERILNRTGKLIDDSAESGLNYTRLNILEAFLMLDVYTPNVSLGNPADSYSNTSRNLTFRCNGTDLQLKNMTFYLWDLNSEIVNETYRSAVDTFNSFEINITNVNYGNYSWNCLYSDFNKSAFAGANRTISILQTLSVVLDSPANNRYTGLNQTFNCSADSDYNLSSISFYIWNSTGIENVTEKNVSGLLNSSSVNYYFTHEDVYAWNCLAAGNFSQGFSSSNYSVTYDLTPPVLNITHPMNDTFYNTARVNVSTNENSTCWYSLDEGLTNSSLSSSNNLNFTGINSTLTDMVDYNATIYCNDSAGNLRWEMRNFTVDLTVPLINLLSPANSYSATTSSTTLAFSFNFSDNLDITSCSLLINSAIVQTNSSITNQTATHQFSYTATPATYSWGVNCTDSAGNLNSSSSRSFTITAPASASSGGGGGGGASTTGMTYVPSAEQVSSGYSRELAKEDKVRFSVSSSEHTMTVNSVGSDYVNLTVASSPVNITLHIGDEKKLSLTSSEYYDLYVKLVGISNSKANLTIQSINEKIPLSEQTSSSANATDRNQTGGSSGKTAEEAGKPFTVLSVIILLAVACGVGYYLYKNLHKNSKKKSR